MQSYFGMSLLATAFLRRSAGLSTEVRTPGPMTAFSSGLRTWYGVNCRTPRRWFSARVRAGSASRASSSWKGIGVFVSSSTRISDIQGHVRLSLQMNLVVPASAVAAAAAVAPVVAVVAVVAGPFNVRRSRRHSLRKASRIGGR